MTQLNSIVKCVRCGRDLPRSSFAPRGDGSGRIRATCLECAAYSRRGFEERFWEKVAIGQPEECWEWQAARVPNGYGAYGGRGRQDGAHRHAWRFTFGEIPEGMYVCHRCDNRRCVNPKHLFLGTAADNARDRDAKGRQARQRGESHGRAKLTEDDVRLIRKIEGLTQQEIAYLFGVSQSCISLIRRGEHWVSHQ